MLYYLIADTALCVLYRPAYAGQNTSALRSRAVWSVCIANQTTNGVPVWKNSKQRNWLANCSIFTSLPLRQLGQIGLLGHIPNPLKSITRSCSCDNTIFDIAIYFFQSYRKLITFAIQYHLHNHPPEDHALILDCKKINLSPHFLIGNMMAGLF